MPEPSDAAGMEESKLRDPLPTDTVITKTPFQYHSPISSMLFHWRWSYK